MAGPRVIARLLAAAMLAHLAMPANAAERAIPVNLAVSSTSFAIGAVQIGEKEGLFAKNGLALKMTVLDSVQPQAILLKAP